MWQHFLTYLKAFFVRYSSEYETSDSDRKVNRNIQPNAATRDRTRRVGPKVANKDLFTIVYLKSSNKKTNSNLNPENPRPLIHI